LSRIDGSGQINLVYSIGNGCCIAGLSSAAITRHSLLHTVELMRVSGIKLACTGFNRMGDQVIVFHHTLVLVG
jgi:hypothetical protein